MSNSNAFMAGLTLIAGTQNYPLRADFNPISLAYRAYVPNGTTTITVTPWLQDASATCKVNGTTVVSGAASTSITVKTGPNTVVIQVTASDTTSYLNYVVTVYVQLASPVLNGYWIVNKDTSVQAVANSQAPFLVQEVIYDQWYRDLPSTVPLVAQLPILTRITPGPTDQVTATDNVLAATASSTATGADDGLHIPPRQLIYQYSHWEFLDATGNILALVPFDTVEDIVNVDPDL